MGTWMLQWGHGDEAVEETSAPGNGARIITCFNGATAMKPWKSQPSAPHSRSLAVLQWGHGDEAVEEVGHSHPTHVQVRRFNGATAMKPWKRPRLLDRFKASSFSFNGATAMKPWKSKIEHVSSPADRNMLQWGHGDEAVEELPSCAAWSISGGASMGPRR